MRIEINGIEELGLDLAKLAELPESVISDMTKAGAEALKKGQDSEGRAMGVVRTGQTLGSLNVRKAGSAAVVEFRGTNSDGNRNAEVAYINNYGKKGQPARPFIDTANIKYEPQIVEAEEQIYNDWLDSLGL